MQSKHLKYPFEEQKWYEWNWVRYKPKNLSLYEKFNKFKHELQHITYPRKFIKNNK